jgi:hypothetical protein
MVVVGRQCIFSYMQELLSLVFIYQQAHRHFTACYEFSSSRPLPALARSRAALPRDAPGRPFAPAATGALTRDAPGPPLAPACTRALAGRSRGGSASAREAEAIALASEREVEAVVLATEFGW